MREIKFRMWDKETEAMYLQEQFAIAGNGLIVFAFDDTRLEKNTNGFSGYEHVRRKNSEKVELMQFTGLFDRNGKEVYEGDVVKILYTDWISCSGCHESPKEHMNAIAKVKVVIWSVNGFYVSREVGGYAESMIPGRYGFIEVIGNIYQNPELLTSN